MLSELTLTVMRLGLLVLMWFFVFAVVGVLRGDLYGTRVKRRAATGKAAARGATPAPPSAARPDRKKGSRGRKGPTKLSVTAGPPLTGCARFKLLIAGARFVTSIVALSVVVPPSPVADRLTTYSPLSSGVNANDAE